MRAAPLLVLVVLLAAGAWWVSRRGGEPASNPASPPHAPADASTADAGPDYVGSEACAACHGELHERWSATAHANTLRDFAPDIPARPFDGEIFLSRDGRHERRLGPGGTMECEGPGGKVRRYDVDLVIGVGRIQMFTTRPDELGRIQVLPVFLEVPARKWFDYSDFIFGGPNQFEIPDDSPNAWYTFARNFNSRCVACHTVDCDVGYDPDTGRYDTAWAERAIGCEACHGPGGAHVRAWERGGPDGADPIVNPVKLPVERANQVCGQCHAESQVVMPGFRPGDDLFAFVDVAGLEDERHLFADGRARELIHNLVPTMESRCGPIACTKCHDAHGRGVVHDLYRPPTDDTTCTQCHDAIADRLEAHTHHPAASAGSRCVGCHMPPLVIEGGHGHVSDHTISIPSIRNTRRHGLPNACRSCHLEDPPTFEYEVFDRWYPDADDRNHRVPLAAAFMARTTDAAPLEALLKDPNPVYRAGAAHALARFPAVDLRPVLADPHPMVRRAAIPGVAARAPAALVPLLDEENHVLRFGAAMALANGPLVREQPELRDRVLQLLEGFAARKPDRDVVHQTIGYLHDVAHRYREAVTAYRRYLRLFPWDPPVAQRVDTLEKFLAQDGGAR